MVKTIVIKEVYTPFQKIKNNVYLFRLNPQDKGVYLSCDEFMINVFSKDALVSSLISFNYPSDKMDAIRNNYDLVRDGVAGDKTEEYTKEYLDMQAWRKKAKELADEIMNEYNKEK